MRAKYRKCDQQPLTFQTMLDRLIDRAYQNGQRIAFSHLYVTCEAVDVDVFVGGELQTSIAAYELLGAYWETLGGEWAGRNGNVNHFYMEAKR